MGRNQWHHAHLPYLPDRPVLRFVSGTTAISCPLGNGFSQNCSFRGDRPDLCQLACVRNRGMRGKVNMSANECSLITQGNAHPFALLKQLVPRVVMEAYGPACERAWGQCEDAFIVLQSASDHVASTAHVVAL